MNSELRKLRTLSGDSDSEKLIGGAFPEFNSKLTVNFVARGEHFTASAFHGQPASNRVCLY